MPQESALRVVLGLAAALVLAVLAAHPAVRRLEERVGLRLFLSSGLPFLALGVAFRDPRVGVLGDTVVADPRPALEFGLGWLGFVVGMQFDVRDLDALPPGTAAVAFAESAGPSVNLGKLARLATAVSRSSTCQRLGVLLEWWRTIDDRAAIAAARDAPREPPQRRRCTRRVIAAIDSPPPPASATPSPAGRRHPRGPLHPLR